LNLILNSSLQRFGGGVQVALSFLYECRNFPEHTYYVWVGPGLAKSLNTEDFNDNFHFQYFDFGVIGLKKLLRIQRTLSRAEKEIRADVIISTSGPSYFKSRTPQLIGFNLPLYLYPESPYLLNFGRKQKFLHYLKSKAHLYFFKRDADAFFVQTHDVNKRVKEIFKSKEVFTITNNANSYFWNFKKREFNNKNLALEPNDECFRFLTISSYYPHKNLELIPEVVKELAKIGVTNVEFVLTLDEVKFLQYIGEHTNIINVGTLKPFECPSVYKLCDALFLPTLAECFSASYPEAMVMGLPIVTTNLGFATSICQDAALYFEPMNAKDAAKAIANLINDSELRSALIKNGKRVVNGFDTPYLRAKKILKIAKNLIKNN
jgi:glycosyltransferase involved in cell wall biosynthesis